MALEEWVEAFRSFWHLLLRRIEPCHWKAQPRTLLVNTMMSAVSFLSWWTIASLIGYTVGHFFGNILGAQVARNFAEPSVSPVAYLSISNGIDLAIVGASLGLAQWAVLRRRVSGTQAWPLATVLGLAVGGFLSPFVTLRYAVQLGASPISGALPLLRPESWAVALAAGRGLVIGNAIATTQSLVLWRRTGVQIFPIPVFFLANAIAWALVELAQLVVVVGMRDTGSSALAIGVVSVFVMSPLSGLLIGGSTGAALMWHLKRHPSQPIQ